MPRAGHTSHWPDPAGRVVTIARRANVKKRYIVLRERDSILTEFISKAIVGVSEIPSIRGYWPPGANKWKRKGANMTEKRAKETPPPEVTKNSIEGPRKGRTWTADQRKAKSDAMYAQSAAKKAAAVSEQSQLKQNQEDATNVKVDDGKEHADEVKPD